MNILFTSNKNYLPKLIALIRSIEAYNGYQNYYIISNDVTLEDIKHYSKYINNKSCFNILEIDKDLFSSAPTSKRYPQEMYYRILAASILPSSLDRVLYLDPDIIVKGNLNELYNMDFLDNYFIGATNINEPLRKFNEIKNHAVKDAKYINTGVILINLKELRKNQNNEEVFNYIKKHKYTLSLPDQDVLSSLYGDKILLISNLIYNLSDRAIRFHNLKIKNINNHIDLSWVEKNTIIIHYLGKNKPWKKNYKGILKIYYDKFKIEEDI